MGHEQDPILQEADPLRESLGDPEKDMDGLEDPEKDVDSLKDLKKDVGNPEDSLGTSHSYVSLKDGKIH